MKKNLLLLFSFCILGIQLQAQDIHLSQFWASDHLLNPAKVGDFDGDYRVTGNYRNQWRQIEDPLTTYVVSFDKAFHYYTHEIDAGIMAARDEFSGFNVVTTKILLSAGYGYVMNGHTFRVGLQPGIVFRKSDLNKQTFPSQWDYNTGTFNTSFATQERSINDNLIEFDLNIGGQWSKRYNKLTPKAGFAIDHLTKPKDTYFNEHHERLRMRKVVHGELDYTASEKISIQPKVLWMWTAKANDLVLGTNIKYNTSNKTIPAVFAGAYYRHGAVRIMDAVIPVVGLTYKRFDVGFSYDINMSSLSANEAKRRSSFEVSLIYTAPSSKPKYKTLPCDRY